jgi:arabinofuranosyltransferase
VTEPLLGAEDAGTRPRQERTPGRSAPPDWWPRAICAVALVTPLVILAVGAWKYRWMSDDAFINLRVVKQLLAGHGPVFNPGERVEASTSPLWLYLLAAADVMTPVRLEWIAVVLGIGLTLAGVASAIAGASELCCRRVRGELLLPVGALVLVVLAPVWKYSSGGLESGLSFAWLGASLWILASWSRRDARIPPWGAAVIGLGPLIRPDLALFSVAFVGLVLASEWSGGWRTRVGVLVWAAALPVAYQVFRMGYYASLVPNPGIAKEAARSYWSPGWTYLRKTIMPYALWFPLAVLAAGAYVPLVAHLRRDARRRALWTVLVFGIVGLAHALYVVRVGGDFMNARLLMPSLFAIAAPVAVAPVRKQFLGAMLVVPWAIVALVGLRSVDDQPRAFDKSTTNAVTLADLGWGRNGPYRAQFNRTGVYFTGLLLPARAKPGEPARVVAGYGIGEVGYALRDAYVLDLLGLADPFTAHLRLKHRGIVAHEKPLPLPWIAARLTAPAPALRASDFPPQGFALAIDEPDHVPFGERVVWARRALDCVTLRDFFAEYRSPLTIGRFVDNLGASFSNWNFRIPPEPRAANEGLCRR